MKKIIFSAIISVGFFTTQAQTFKPGMKLQKGEQYEIVTAVNGSMQQAGMTMPVESTLKSIALVKDETANGFFIGTENKSFVFKSNAMGEDISYDSDKKDNVENPMTASFKDVAGKKDSFRVDKNGNVMLSPEKDLKKKDQATGMMNMMMSNPGDASAGVPIFNVLPRFTALKPGESITDSTENNADGKEKTVTTFTLSEIKDGKVKILIDGLTSMEKTIETEQMGMKMTIQVNSNISNKGEMIIDEATGILISKNLTSDTDGTMSVSGMTLPMTGSSTIVTTVKKS